MKTCPCPPPTKRPPARHRPRWIGLAAAAGLIFAAASALAQSDGFRLLRPTPGGIDPHPVITSLTDTQGLAFEWFGFQGPYQVQRQSLIGGPWTDVGAPTFSTRAVVTKPGSAGFHRIKGGNPNYQGAGVCADCHAGVHDNWSKTTHAHAYQTLRNIGQQNNQACVVCHTVGAGVPSGFINDATTPHFANVQCENCHGPAGGHVESGDPPTLFPVVARSAMLCGGCHNGFHHPTYDEWTSSPHSAVVAELAEQFDGADRTAAVARMSACGACHSGAVRLAMLSANRRSTFAGRTNVNWPTGHEAAETPVTCIVCHDVHDTHVYTNVLTRAVYTNQLRNPISSTNVFSYNTGTNFASQYNPNVNVCAQCHNARGASVASSSRPPHYSPQYNILLGAIGVTSASPLPQGAHKNSARQCAGCHTHGHGEAAPSPDDPAYTGHGFRATIQACMACHTNSVGPMSATNLLFATQAEVSGLIATTKNLLDLWASTKNTNSWASKYETRGWEYTTPGELSNPSGSTSIVGPTSGEQAQIPQGIKDARFNLYLVNRDKSLGVHNAPYTRHLLQVAQQRVNAELAR